jgi:hypothetical protein
MAIAVDLRLRRFSRAFDNLIETFSQEYVQIQSETHKIGLFRVALSRAEVVLAALDVHRDTTFDSFLDLCFSIFWNSVDHSLAAIRSYIDGSLLPAMNNLFIDLVRDVEVITGPVPTPELDNAIRNAQTHSRHALDQVTMWFQLPKPPQPMMMTFQSLVEIGLQAIKNMYHEFNPKVNYSIDDNLPLFFQLQKFTDIFMIVFDNIWRHGGMRNPTVEVRARVDGGYLLSMLAREKAVVTRTHLGGVNFCER